jgi:phosphoribosylanthranilate isomerase
MNVKVCGMREEKNIHEVADLRPDYLGFIFYDRSPRFVGDDFEMPKIDPFIQKVGVFVNATTEEILAKAVIHNLHMVQLHGHETVEQCEELRAHNTLIIKAFSLDDKFNFQDVKKYHTAVDYFLFDTKGKYFGGNATRFDWSILTGYDQQTPFFLSGGLSPGNVAEVKSLNDMNIHAIDINSGVEISPGLKDVNKIRQVMTILNEVK